MQLWKDCGCGCDGAIAKQRFVISILSAATFFVIMNSQTYKLTRDILGSWVAAPGGCPTSAGFILHVLVFGLVALAMMGKFNMEKLKISAFSASLVYIISNEKTYQVTSKLLGRWVADASGCPTGMGLLLHSLVFLAVTYLVMNNKRVKKSD